MPRNLEKRANEETKKSREQTNLIYIWTEDKKKFFTETINRLEKTRVRGDDFFKKLTKEMNEQFPNEKVSEDIVRNKHQKEQGRKKVILPWTEEEEIFLKICIKEGLFGTKLCQKFHARFGSEERTAGAVMKKYSDMGGGKNALKTLLENFVKNSAQTNKNPSPETSDSKKQKKCNNKWTDEQEKSLLQIAEELPTVQWGETVDYFKKITEKFNARWGQSRTDIAIQARYRFLVKKDPQVFVKEVWSERQEKFFEECAEKNLPLREVRSKFESEFKKTNKVPDSIGKKYNSYLSKKIMLGEAENFSNNFAANEPRNTENANQQNFDFNLLGDEAFEFQVVEPLGSSNDNSDENEVEVVQNISQQGINLTNEEKEHIEMMIGLGLSWEEAWDSYEQKMMRNNLNASQIQNSNLSNNNLTQKKGADTNSFSQHENFLSTCDRSILSYPNNPIQFFVAINPFADASTACQMHMPQNESDFNRNANYVSQYNVDQLPPPIIGSMQSHPVFKTIAVEQMSTLQNSGNFPFFNQIANSTQQNNGSGSRYPGNSISQNPEEENQQQWNVNNNDPFFF